ncbi:hypothetical protein R7Q39_19400 [Vibrio sp. 947]|uniref:hypothetical protein n=1 Tax=unclassified Vibrio TaxID=2614977 RepID=UPI002964D857|nr:MULTISPECIES: hypothetical protein [unclassified Vibrio]MDW1583299.1 hypothetical protein [Vibrio sp. Vb2897]MDW1641591.1 hypothetical protein [Vibrio sp. Vb2896]MDW1927599.1 hypothetical protein [Vibrio sp. 947]
MKAIDRLKDLHFSRDPALYDQWSIERIINSIQSAKENKKWFENASNNARIYRVIAIEPCLFAAASVIAGIVYLFTSNFAAEIGIDKPSALILYLMICALGSIPFYLIRWVSVIPRAKWTNKVNWSWKEVLPYNLATAKDKSLAHNFKQRKANKAEFLSKEKRMKDNFSSLITPGSEFPYEYVHKLTEDSEVRAIYIKMLRDQLENRLNNEKALIQNRFEQLVGTEMHRENESWSEISNPDHRIYGSFKE